MVCRVAIFMTSCATHAIVCHLPHPTIMHISSPPPTVSSKTPFMDDTDGWFQTPFIDDIDSFRFNSLRTDGWF